MNKCQPVALGIAIGITWAAGVLFLAIIAMFGWGVPLVDLLGSVYLGYGASIAGAIIGTIWGFVDGFIAGFIVGWIYNKVAK